MKHTHGTPMLQALHCLSTHARSIYKLLLRDPRASTGVGLYRQVNEPALTTSNVGARRRSCRVFVCVVVANYQADARSRWRQLSVCYSLISWFRCPACGSTEVNLATVNRVRSVQWRVDSKTVKTGTPKHKSKEACLLGRSCVLKRISC